MEQIKTLRERNNEAVRKHAQKCDSINIRFEKGTADRIRALGFTPTTFCKNLVLSELDKLEKMK